MDWSTELKTRRNARGFTQEQMAEYLDIGLSTYFKIEQGFCRPGKLLNAYLHLKLGIPAPKPLEPAMT